ncbi:MAG: signal peptidase II, partial [Pseudomonadota bacterium]
MRVLKRFSGLYILAWVLADQGIKYWVLNRMSTGDVIPVLPGFDLRLGFNPGIAFGLYHDVGMFARGLMYSFIGALIIWVAMEAGKAIERGNQLSILAWITVLAGALGNYIDRLWRGAVVDYIDLYYGQWHWYTFNLA